MMAPNSPHVLTRWKSLQISLYGVAYVTLSGLDPGRIPDPGLRFGRMRGLRCTWGSCYFSLSGLMGR